MIRTEGPTIDDLLAAAFVPDLWPKVLQGVADAAGALGTVLFTSDTRSVFRWTASDSIRALMEIWTAENWQAKCERPARMLKANRQGFIRDIDVYTMEELEAEESWTGFHRPNGLGWAAGSFVMIPTGDVAVISVERRYVDGPMSDEDIARLDALRPHLARAALVAIRNDYEKAATATRLLEALGLPACAASRGGRVVVANDGFQTFRGLSIGAGDQIRVAHDGAQALLLQALGRSQEDGFGGASIPLPSSGGLPAVIHVIPIRREAHDIFGRTDAFVVVTPVQPAETAPAALLSGLFDLSAAEARVAAGIAAGLSVDAIAEQHGRSRETIRSHLKQIFQKSGVSRQAELATLLGRVAAVQPKA